jgi:lysine decarboxylase/arginine decarboxylase
MDLFSEFPVLIIDNDLMGSSAGSRAVRAIVEALEAQHIPVLEAPTVSDAEVHLRSLAKIGCILLDWELDCSGNSEYPDTAVMVRRITDQSMEIPLFLMTDKLSVADIPLEVMKRIDGYIWALEDTPDFIAGRIDRALKHYVENLMPPFLKALYDYVQDFRYSWHTPGHMGGVAFLKSPIGKVFHRFFGENLFRSDISASVPDLGSPLEHTGVAGESEKQAARIFGADRTYYVTNGTSTANKMVFHACVKRGDLVLLDRNCHKSIIQAVIMTGAIPIYIRATRNALGIIGPAPVSELTRDSIMEKIDRCPFIEPGATPRIKLAVLTNSTYDGLCYNTEMVKEMLEEICDNILFDEAWYAYARFHDLYEERYGMYQDGREHKPTVYAAQSSHKVLAAISQGSMLHVKEGARPFDHDRFNEAFMMHSSTSPLYGIIASLDVAARMMQGGLGRSMVEDALEEAVVFRLKMENIGRQFGSGGGWWFGIWQPQTLLEDDPASAAGFDQAAVRRLVSDPSGWRLDPGDDWHGFRDVTEGYVMLDPLKVTIQTAGLERDGSMAEKGIPACLVARFLRERGIVVEKTGFYSMLVLFTLGITKGKSGTLLAELFDFRKALDESHPISLVFPGLADQHPEIYFGRTLADLVSEMHEFLREKMITTILSDIFSGLPEQRMLPDEAYGHLVSDGVEEVTIGHLEGRVSAVTVVPYPPGIPMVMPGEVFCASGGGVQEFLSIIQEFHNRFPGFEGEVHGARIRRMEDGTFIYSVDCVRE